MNNTLQVLKLQGGDVLEVLSCYLQREVKKIFADNDEFPPHPLPEGYCLKSMVNDVSLLWIFCNMNALEVVPTLKKC